MPTIIVVIIKLAWHFTLVHNICVCATLWRFSGAFTAVLQQTYMRE